MVVVDVTPDTDDLVAGVTAAVFVVIELADVVFDDDYIVVCVVVDSVVVAGLVVVFVVVAVDNAGVHTVAYVDA